MKALGHQAALDADGMGKEDLVPTAKTARVQEVGASASVHLLGTLALYSVKHANPRHPRKYKTVSRTLWFLGWLTKTHI